LANTFLADVSVLRMSAPGPHCPRCSRSGNNSWRRLYFGAGGPQFRIPLHQVRPLGQRLVDGSFNGIADAVRHLDVLDTLHVKLRGGRSGESRCQIAIGNLRCPHRRLQIVVGLRRGTAHLGARRARSPIRSEAGFSGLLHGLRVLEVRFCRVLPSFAIQKPVIGLHHWKITLRWVSLN